MKESDGNPEIKGKMKQLRMARVKKRMMAAVPKATVIVTNPTHYAVALRYEAGMAAPTCVAKGVDAMALRIRAVAAEHGVAVIENPPLGPRRCTAPSRSIARSRPSITERVGRGDRLRDAHAPPRRVSAAGAPIVVRGESHASSTFFREAASGLGRGVGRRSLAAISRRCPCPGAGTGPNRVRDLERWRWPTSRDPRPRAQACRAPSR